MGRVRSSALIAIAGVALLGACGRDSAERDATSEGAPTDGPELFEAGSPMGEGFLVPDGSVALAQPIISRDRPAPAWDVEFLPSDPIAAMNDLVVQAAELGFELGGWTPTPCVYDDEPEESGVSAQQPWPMPPRQPTPRSITCTVEGRRERDGTVEQIWMATGLDLVDHLGRTAGASGRIEFWVGDVGFGFQHQFGTTASEPLPDDLGGPGEPPTAPQLAPGDPLFTTSPDMWESWRPTLVDGSRLVVPARTPICQGGFDAVLDVTGDPDAVMDGYVEQIRDWSEGLGAPPTTSEHTLFDRRIVHSVASIDGTSLSATMVIGRDGEPTRMRYLTCSG